jgi:hypothetical protein
VPDKRFRLIPFFSMQLLGIAFDTKATALLVIDLGWLWTIA